MPRSLGDKLPDCVYVNNRKYKVRPTMGRVLTAFEIIENQELEDAEKIDLCLKLLLKHKFTMLFLPPKTRISILQKILNDIIKTGKARKQGPKAMDFVQDSEYIYGAFWQTYNIDLNEYRDKLHWWSFKSLLSSLPEDTRLMQIVSIRTRPIPKPTKYNTEDRLRLARLKQEYGLKKTEEERQADWQSSLISLAKKLEAVATRKK